MASFDQFRLWFKGVVNIGDQIDTEMASRHIKTSIWFKGPNVWILAFSVIIASVGLNINSTAVIIGAMLISPLMGPIMGIGLALGTNDMKLLKESLRNFLVMVLVSLAASFVYFLLSPLNLVNPTELQARTRPTIFDVLIALFGGLAGILETTMDEETETDLFGEQTVLCGGVVDLMQCGFEVLVEAGYKPENAYFECIHEMKLIIDLINKGGIAAMNYSISDTAEFGEYVSGPRVLPHDEVKANMRKVLADIQDGTFAGKWIAENKNGRTFFNSKRAQLAKHEMEVVGKKLRDEMLWKNDTDLDSASN